MLLRNRLYAGIVDVPEYGVRAKRGDFQPLLSEDLFYRVQAVLSGRVRSTTPQQRAHPDFPLRAFVRCEFCGRGLTGSWSKGGAATISASDVSQRHSPNPISGSVRRRPLAVSSANRTKTSICHGRPFARVRHRPDYAPRAGRRDRSSRPCSSERDQLGSGERTRSTLAPDIPRRDCSLIHETRQSWRISVRRADGVADRARCRGEQDVRILHTAASGERPA